jgi:phosphoglucomutase
MNSSLDKAKQWLQAPFDQKTQDTINQWIAEGSADLDEAFYTNLEFGTGGMRGIMGVGTNRLNPYTLGQATQGLANYINQMVEASQRKVAIAYDVRHNSQEFAKIVADVLTANNIQVFLFENHRPTPELSFAVRQLKCTAGIVLTASHNPPEYNGYKVYWDDGGQIVPPEDKAIIAHVNAVAYADIQFDGQDELITYLGAEMDELFVNACVQNATYQSVQNQDLHIIFTALHGTTHSIVPMALQKAGFEHVHFVDEQMIPSGNFPTVDSPNPEDPKALQMAMDKAKQVNADILIGTDPDGDRLGIGLRDDAGQMQLINGNQANTLLTYYILKQWEAQGKLNPKTFIASTIVSSDVCFAFAQRFGIACQVGLTGFKWIGKMIKDAPEDAQFICGGEESFGFLVSDFVRDKDSVGSIVLACEVAAYCKTLGKSAYTYLQEIYQELGLYHEELLSLTKKGKNGLAEIEQMMKDFRENPPKSMAGSPITELRDYQEQSLLLTETGQKTSMTDLPKANVLIYYSQDGSKVCIRPSGTEPKIKFYFGAKTNFSQVSDFEASKVALSKKIEQVKVDLGL